MAEMLLKDVREVDIGQVDDPLAKVQILHIGPKYH